MNKSYRSVWNESSGEWVAAPEFARGRGGSALRNTVLGCVSLLSGAVWAACTGGGAGQSSVGMVADGGSSCSVDATLTSVAVPGGTLIMQANGAGSTWMAGHDMDLAAGVFAAANSQRWGVAATAGGQVLLNGGRYSVETNAWSTAHGVNSSGAGSLIRVQGDLTVTINGGGNSNANTATRGIIGLTGGVVEVLGHTTVNTTNLLWPAGGNNRGISAEGGTIRLNSATVDTKGAGGIGILSAGANSLVVAVGAVNVTTAGSSASGLVASGTGQVALADASVLTEGVQSHGIQVSGGGKVTAQGAVIVETKGTSARGVWAAGAGSAIELGSAQVSTLGDGDAYGLSAGTGGRIAVTGLADITIQNSGASAVIAGEGGGVGTIQLGSVKAASDNHVLGAYNAGSRIDVQGDATLTARGTNARGISAESGGVVSVGGTTTVNHTSDFGLGVAAVNNGSRVELQSLDLTTAGDGRLGVVASVLGVITATQMNVRTTGASAGGIRAVAGGIVTVTGAMNVDVAGTGGDDSCDGGAAICVMGNNSAVTGGNIASASTIRSTSTAVRFQSGANQVVALDNVSLSTTGASSDLVSVYQAVGTSALNLKNSTATAGAGGLLLNVASGSTLAFDNEATTLTGDIKASADSTVNMALRNGSRLTGKIDPIHLAIDATSRWDVTGNSELGTLTNAGTVHMLPGVGGLAGAYKTVTVDSYTGQGGRINLNTYLGDDSSPSDRLVINGGTATGTTTLGITNAGGPGAQTTGNGILLVDAQNGATTATNAFSAAGPVSAGAYDYSLVRRANESWYLTSDLVPPVDPGMPKPPVNPGRPETPTPETPTVKAPNYRQETSLYAAVPSLANLHSAATMDSFHERVGAAGPVAGLADRPTRLWARVIGNTGERKGDAQGVYGRTGPAFDHKTYALQLGGELYRGANADGSQTAAGVYLATGRTSGDVEHFNGQTAGNVKLDVSSLGVYWTVLGPAGGYVDFVAQGNHYGVTATSTRMPEVKTSGTGYDFSVEGGWPFQLSGAWTLEPQVQARLMAADFDRAQDIAGRVGYDDAESLVGRAGLKLAYKGSDLTGWARLDLLKEFKGRSKTQVASLWGTNGVDFHSSVHGAAVALTAGVDAKLTDKVSLYGAASYRRALGDNRGHAWGAQAGVKVAW